MYLAREFMDTTDQSQNITPALALRHIFQKDMPGATSSATDIYAVTLQSFLLVLASSPSTIDSIEFDSCYPKTAHFSPLDYKGSI